MFTILSMTNVRHENVILKLSNYKNRKKAKVIESGFFHIISLKCQRSFFRLIKYYNKKNWNKKVFSEPRSFAKLGPAGNWGKFRIHTKFKPKQLYVNINVIRFRTIFRE